MKKLNPKSIDQSLRTLSLANSKPPAFYKKEARQALKKYSLSDRNFKHFFSEFVDLSKGSIETETLREVVSSLQKHLCIRINAEYNKITEMTPIRNKIKIRKKEFYDNEIDYDQESS